MIVSVASLSRLQLKLVLDKLETSIIGQVALASNRKYRIKIVCAQGATDLRATFLTFTKLTTNTLLHIIVTKIKCLFHHYEYLYKCLEINILE